MTTPRQSVGCEDGMFKALHNLRHQSMTTKDANDCADAFLDLLAACEEMLKAGLAIGARAKAHKQMSAAVAKARGMG